MMETFLSILSSICLILVCLVVLAFLVAAILEYISQIHGKLWWGRDEVIRREIGVQLVREAYWYSESDDAMHAIQSIGEALRDYGTYEISKARDKWHELRKQPEQ